MLLVDGMEADQAFLVARFAAPTSAGILFSMLEGAGLRDTWVFGKARILAIFDDLDTILLMIPLKIFMIGFKWELMVVIGIMVILLAFAWRYLHRLDLPYSSAWSIVYAAVVTACCYALYKVTKYYLPMEAIHIEVLLPAFVVGCMINTPCARHELQLQRQASMRRQESKELKALALSDTAPPVCVEDEAAAVELGNGKLGGKLEDDVEEGSDIDRVSRLSGDSEPSRRGSDDDGLSKESRGSELSRHGHPKEESHPHESNWEHNVQTSISMVFMVLVGLSMPPLAGKNAKSDSNMAASLIAVHVLTVSLLMIIGKMFPVLCYRDEASWKERLALCMGMCPRGEVGASIIVISLELGVEGPAVIISMCALVINLVLSGGFIGSVKLLLKQVATAESHNTAGPQAKSVGSGDVVTLASDF
jgi:Kef-type K+ transport system membrane component KefB